MFGRGAAARTSGAAAQAPRKPRRGKESLDMSSIMTEIGARGSGMRSRMAPPRRRHRNLPRLIRTRSERSTYLAGAAHSPAAFEPGAPDVHRRVRSDDAAALQTAPSPHGRTGPKGGHNIHPRSGFRMACVA